MNEDAFNMSVRKFLKKVGVTAQREIEQAVREAEANGKLTSGAFGTLDPSVIYTLFYPSTTTISQGGGPLGEQKSCSSFGDPQAPLGAARPAGPASSTGPPRGRREAVPRESAASCGCCMPCSWRRRFLCCCARRARRGRRGPSSNRAPRISRHSKRKRRARRGAATTRSPATGALSPVRGARALDPRLRRPT